MTVINSTKYCDLLKQGKVQDDESVYAIEKIHVKEKDTEEVRFPIIKKVQMEKKTLYQGR